MAAKTTHGMSKTRVYEIWASMRKRCHSPGGKTFQRYGTRGIVVCERWRASFEAFYADMGEPPDGMSLERIDNNGPYAPENCRWATAKEQQRNRRNTIRLTLDGVTKPLAEWAEVIGISPITLSTRWKRGWTDQQILTTPVQKRGGLYERAR